MTHRLVATAAGAPDVRPHGPRLALAALLCASLATAEETTPSSAPVSNPAAGSGPSAVSTSEGNGASGSPAARAPSDYRWLAWTGVAAGGVLLAASAWQWVVFAHENADAGELCRARRAGLARCADAEERDAYLTARDDAKRARTLAAIFGGLGAASLVSGLLLLPDAEAGSGQARIAVSADPFAGDARASVCWTW